MLKFNIVSSEPASHFPGVEFGLVSKPAKAFAIARQSIGRPAGYDDDELLMAEFDVVDPESVISRIRVFWRFVSDVEESPKVCLWVDWSNVNGELLVPTDWLSIRLTESLDNVNNASPAGCWVYSRRMQD